MRHAVDAILNRRLQAERGGLRGATLMTSAGLHAVFLTAAIAAPLLTAREAAPVEFVSVQIVPVQALGERRPQPPPRSEPRREAEPEPPPAPEPEAKPQPEAKPERVVAPQAKPARQEPRKEPARARTPPAPEPPPEIERREGSPLGSSLGTSAFGAPAVAGLDSPDFVYGYWVEQMLSMIAGNWNRPALGGDVAAVVYFRVARDGEVSGLRILTSSGYNSFDLAGLRAVQLASPLPRLPQSFDKDSLGVKLILR